MRPSLCVLALVLLVSGCAGYHLGPTKPNYLKDVHTIAIPTFQNETFVPRIEVLITNTVIKQFQQDGTFKIANEDRADAVLRVKIVKIGRQPVRSLAGNVLATTEFNLGLTVSYTLVDHSGHTLLGPVGASGLTSFFVNDDVTTEERQALPLAAEDMAVRLVSQLSEGW